MLQQTDIPKYNYQMLTYVLTPRRRVLEYLTISQQSSNVADLNCENTGSF
jgi:hypothetical protein